MNKNEILESLVHQLEENLSLLVHTAHEAREAATGDESKAENKYDTRGLEASYLAGAQAKRSEELKQSILLLKRLRLRDYDENTPINLTALLEVEQDTGEKKYFFILPAAGGTKITSQNQTILVLTPESPIGKALMTKVCGDVISLKINQKNSEYEILQVQ